MSLMELCAIRGDRTNPTYICFLDQRKAFDTVPICAMLTKLRKIGVRGRAFNFVRALYNGSLVAVRKADGSAGPSIPVLRGVRRVPHFDRVILVPFGVTR